MRITDLTFQILSGLLVLADAIFLGIAATGEAVPRSTLPFILASGASLSAAVALFIKNRTNREGKWGLYLFIIIVGLMLANSFFNTNIRSSLAIPLALSSVCFILTGVSFLQEFRTQRSSDGEDYGCLIQGISVLALTVQVVLLVLFLIFHSLWE